MSNETEQIEIKHRWTGEALLTIKGSSLVRADLTDANLTDANLTDAWLPTGEQFDVYLREVVPALLAAGGKTVAEVVRAGAWDCHEWTNCPMAHAFSVHREEDCPVLLRPRVLQFVQLYDANLIPCPEVASPVEETAGAS